MMRLCLSQVIGYFDIDLHSLHDSNVALTKLFERKDYGYNNIHVISRRDRQICR